MKLDDITLDLRIPNGLQGLRSVPEEEQSWTLQEAVDSLKEQRLVRILENDPEKLSELLGGFWRAVEDGRTPKIGQTWAAYHHAAHEKALADWLADRSTRRQYAARQAAITRLVFRKSYK